MPKKCNSLLSFLEKVESIPKDCNGCKIWPMGISRTGYGVYSIKNFTYSVPRLLFNTLRSGTYMDGLVVRHKCDNRACCNIDHLEIGTQSQNIMDASIRRRLKFGEENKMSIFKEEQILQIREKYPKFSTVDLAKEYGTSSGVIRNIIIGKTWKNLPGAKDLNYYNRAVGEKMGRSKLTEQQVIQIRESYPLKSGPQLAKEFGVTHCNIYCILNRKNWTHI